MPEDNMVAGRLKNATPLEQMHHMDGTHRLVCERAGDTPNSQLLPPLDEPNPMEWTTKKLYTLTSAGHAIRGQESHEKVLQWQGAMKHRDDLLLMLELCGPVDETEPPCARARASAPPPRGTSC